jgi:hypothetical protein
VNEEQLIELLSVYRYRQPMPALTRRLTARWWLAAAAAVLIGTFVFWMNAWRDGWRILRAGETISQATRLERRSIGYVDVAADTVLKFQGGNRLALQRGTIHAKVTSQPGIFIVDTPRATAVDLGCEYTLSIAANGSGRLHVTAGWVSLDNRTQSLVPAGASATIDAGGQLSPPVLDDALPQFKAAIAQRDIEAALPLARRRDTITLLHLFRFATPEQRLKIYERLNALVPAQPGARPGWIEPWWPDVIKKKVSSLPQ